MNIMLSGPPAKGGDRYGMPSSLNLFVDSSTLSPRTKIYGYIMFNKIRKFLRQEEPPGEKPEVLYPHRLIPGYYISLEEIEVYSIKSGRLKRLKKSTWKGKTTVAMSHKGKAVYQNLNPKILKKFIEKRPKHTIMLNVKY